MADYFHLIRNASFNSNELIHTRQKNYMVSSKPFTFIPAENKILEIIYWSQRGLWKTMTLNIRCFKTDFHDKVVQSNCRNFI